MVGYGRVDGMTVCELAGCVAAVCVGCVAGCEACDADDVRDADGVRDADDVRDADGIPDADARAEVFAVPDDLAADPVEALLVAPWPVGDGVRAPVLAADEPDVCGDGVKMVGVADPVPPMHPETVTARSTAPAAERPANSHPVCASEVVRRIFMNPPPI